MRISTSALSLRSLLIPYDANTSLFLKRVVSLYISSHGVGSSQKTVAWCVEQCRIDNLASEVCSDFRVRYRSCGVERWVKLLDQHSNT